MLNKFFRWVAKKIVVAESEYNRNLEVDPDKFYEKEPRKEYILIQNTPTGAFVELTYWSNDTASRSGRQGTWITEARVAANGETVEQAITLLRVQAALKCQN